MKPPVTPSEHRRAVRYLAATREAYRAARRLALAARREHRHEQTGRAMLRAERALGEALDKRHDWHCARRWLAECVARGVEKYANVSPAAAARLAARRGGAV